MYIHQSSCNGKCIDESTGDEVYSVAPPNVEIIINGNSTEQSIKYFGVNC